MNYEKAYKEALERMKSWARGEHPECFSEAKKAAEFIFPELKESEDEKIRKSLIDLIKGIDSWNYFLGISREQMISWLEKQGEQKPSWNEIDEKNLSTIVNVIHGGTHLAYENEIDWLKSLKDRIKGE